MADDDDDDETVEIFTGVFSRRPAVNQTSS